MLMLVKNGYVSIRQSFRAKNITKDEEGLIMKKGWINQEDMPFLNIHAHYFKIHEAKNNGTSREIDKSTIITRGFKTILSIIEGTSRQKEPKQFSQPTGPNWHLPHTPPNNNRIYIFHILTEHLPTVYILSHKISLTIFYNIFIQKDSGISNMYMLPLSIVSKFNW